MFRLFTNTPIKSILASYFIFTKQLFQDSIKFKTDFVCLVKTIFNQKKILKKALCELIYTRVKVIEYVSINCVEWLKKK